MDHPRINIICVMWHSIRLVNELGDPAGLHGYESLLPHRLIALFQSTGLGDCASIYHACWRWGTPTKHIGYPFLIIIVSQPTKITHSLNHSLALSQLIAIRANNFHHEARSIYFSHHGHPVLWLSCSADGESRPHSMGSSCNAEQTTATSRRALQLPTRLWTFPS